MKPVKTAAVIDESKQTNGKTRFTLYWAGPPREDDKMDPRPVDERWRRAQCFNAILEEHLSKNPLLKVVPTASEAWDYVRPSKV